MYILLVSFNFGIPLLRDIRENFARSLLQKRAIFHSYIPQKSCRSFVGFIFSRNLLSFSTTFPFSENLRGLYTLPVTVKSPRILAYGFVVIEKILFLISSIISVASLSDTVLLQPVLSFIRLDNCVFVMFPPIFVFFLFVK